MAIGSEFSQYGRTGLKRALYKFIGTTELHTQLRLRPMIKHLPNWLPKKPITIVECGCGCGVNLFELAKLRGDISFIGYDLSADAIELGRRVQRQFFADRPISLNCADATQLDVKDGGYDCILLMDVLEHIHDDAALAGWAMRSLRIGGILCVSVPTHRYSEVFGDAFHRQVGHVRSGYTNDELAKLFPTLETVGTWYNTGRYAQLGCRLYYKHAQSRRSWFLRFIMTMSCRFFFAWPDFFNGPDSSCSLFTILIKRS